MSPILGIWNIEKSIKEYKQQVGKTTTVNIPTVSGVYQQQQTAIQNWTYFVAFCFYDDHDDYAF